MQLREFFEGLLQYKKDIGNSDKTIKEYANIIKRVLTDSVGGIDISSVRLIDVSKVIDAGRSHGQFGALRATVVFRQLLRYIKESGNEIAFDWRDIKLPSTPHKKAEWLDHEEWLTVIGSFDVNTMSGLRDRALVEVLRATGMRIGEALSMDRDDLNWEKKEAIITNCKTKDRETVYFNDDSINWLNIYLSTRNDSFSPLFVTMNGRRPSPCSIRRTIHNSVKKAGIKKRVHPHIFRSTYGTELLRSGVDIKTVQTLMRHKSERTTLKHYIAVSQDHCKLMHSMVMNRPHIDSVGV